MSWFFSDPLKKRLRKIRVPPRHVLFSFWFCRVTHSQKITFHLLYPSFSVEQATLSLKCKPFEGRVLGMYLLWRVSLLDDLEAGWITLCFFLGGGYSWRALFYFFRTSSIYPSFLSQVFLIPYRYGSHIVAIWDPTGLEKVIEFFLH